MARKPTRAQKKRLAQAMLAKAEKVSLAEAMTLKEYGDIMRVKQAVLKRLGYDPRR